ncbi:hypothetical protein RZE82_01905 [Mollicutes bacterium LVI A0039]|nr:hypothetical protein RZE82_01905 [Mollicutes bacterium LVI A0039]
MSERKYNTPIINETAEGVTITHIDPDFPSGELEHVTAEEIVDSWLETNYPNINKEQLSDIGIEVSFVAGPEEYILNGNIVTKEEYMKKADSDDYLQIVQNGNDGKLNRYSHDPANPMENIGSSHKEPGKIKIDINSDQVLASVDAVMNTELTYDQATKLELFVQKTLGVVNVTLTGKSIKDAYDEIKALLQADDISAKNFRVAAVVASVVIEPAMDVADLENLWDADESERAKYIDGIAKKGDKVLILIGLVDKSIEKKFPLAIITAGIFFGISDLLIKDYDELEIFKINEDGKLEYDFDLKNSSGSTVHYNGEIKLDYEDPEHLMNQVNLYLETAKLQLSYQLDVLRNKRVDIIRAVKQDLEDDIRSLALRACVGRSTIDYTKDDDVKTICDIYDIDFLPNGYVIFDTEEGYYFDPEEQNIEVEISCIQEGLLYRLRAVDKYTPLRRLDDVICEDGKLPKERYEYAVLYKKPSEWDIIEHYQQYYKSYYRYHMMHSEYKKDDLVDAIANDKCIRTGSIDVDGYTAMYLENDIKEEAKKQSASFMSRNRNLLADELVQGFYNNVLAEVYKYSDLTAQIESLETELVSFWDDTYTDRSK